MGWMVGKAMSSIKEIIIANIFVGSAILGGNKFGIDTALVLSGNTLRGSAAEQIHSTGIIPDYICGSAVIN